MSPLSFTTHLLQSEDDCRPLMGRAERRLSREEKRMKCIWSERGYGMFSASVVLPGWIDPASLTACLIFLHWPSSSAWVVGTLVGISFLFSGIARLTMPVYRRQMMLLEI